MTITQRFGICLMFIAVYGCAVQSIPKDTPSWQYGVIQLCLTFGIMLFMMFGRNKE